MHFCTAVHPFVVPVFIGVLEMGFAAEVAPVQDLLSIIKSSVCSCTAVHTHLMAVFQKCWKRGLLKRCGLLSFSFQASRFLHCCAHLSTGWSRNRLQQRALLERCGVRDFLINVKYSVCSCTAVRNCFLAVSIELLEMGDAEGVWSVSDLLSNTKCSV